MDRDRQLLLRLQEETDLPGDMWIVMVGAHGQTVLNPLVREEYLRRVEFADGGDREALRLMPMGHDQPVVMDPLLSSGAATVHGVRCDALAELVDAGETVEDVAHTFRLDIGDVKAALAYAWQTAA